MLPRTEQWLFDLGTLPEPFPWNDGSGSPVDVGWNRNVRLGNNRDKDNSLTKKLGLHAFGNLQEDFSILCCVLFWRRAVGTCPTGRSEGGCRGQRRVLWVSKGVKAQALLEGCCWVRARPASFVAWEGRRRALGVVHGSGKMQEPLSGPLWPLSPAEGEEEWAGSRVGGLRRNGNILFFTFTLSGSISSIIYSTSNIFWISSNTAQAPSHPESLPDHSDLNKPLLSLLLFFPASHLLKM